MTPTVGLAAYGDPADRRTWSGTPWNLIAALSDMDLTVLPLNSSSNSKLAKGVAAGVHFGRTRSLDWRRSPASFRLAGQSLEQSLNGASVDSILHCSTHAVTYAARQGLARTNVLYLDSTWRTMTAWGRSGGMTEKNWRRIDELESAAYRAASRIAVTGPHVANSLVKHYGIDTNVISVVGTGTGPISPARKSHSGPPSLLMVAKVGFDYKGGWLLLEAFDRLRSLRDDVTLTVVAGDAHSQIRPQAGLRVFKSVSLPELQSFFADSWLYVMPALNEPWGLVYLEAMLTETPVVGLRRNALPHMTNDGEYGFLLQEPDVIGLTAVLQEALDGPEALLDVGRQAREATEQRFTWRRTSEALTALLI